ncbi:MAG: MarR family transcriptional regulator [Firmicutes bacterium]|nr:MarR family transcriptional regulator [Bacillota bacterium]
MIGVLSTQPAGVDRQVAEIEELLRAVGAILKKRARDILSNFRITPPQLDALLVLNEHGELTMGELCQRLFLACSTATDLIDRMERNQLIERVRDTADRRVIRLRLLEKGRRIIAEVLEARRSYLSGVLGDVSPAQKEQIIQSLQILSDRMGRG